MLLDDVVEGFRIAVRQIRRRRLTYVFAIAYLTALAIVPLISLWMVDPSRFRAFWAKVSLPESEVTVILALSGVFVFLSQLMLRYLRADSEPHERRSYFESLDFSKRLGKLEQAAGGLTPKIREELVATLKADAAGQMATEFEAHFRRSYAPAMEVTKRAAHLRVNADRMLSRLQAEIRALMRRGNLNLVLGTLTTAGALAILLWVALTATLAVDNWRQYLPMYLLRLSGVAFIEIFAFFFLRLYRASLADIKYFQNEITNLEAKCLAFELVLLAGDKAGTTKVVNELARTERNFILKKDETTIELEKARLESQQVGKLIGAVKDLLPSIKKIAK